MTRVIVALVVLIGLSESMPLQARNGDMCDTTHHISRLRWPSCMSAMSPATEECRAEVQAYVRAEKSYRECVIADYEAPDPMRNPYDYTTAQDKIDASEKRQTDMIRRWNCMAAGYQTC
jgi:hypothetical protein